MPEETPEPEAAAHRPPAARPTARLDRLEEEGADLREVVLKKEEQGGESEPEEPEKTEIEEREPDPTDPPAEEEAEPEHEAPAAPAPAHKPGILW